MTVSREIERDLDQQFREKLFAAVRHTIAMYDVAGISTGQAQAAIVAECLKLATGIVAKSTGMPRDIYLRFCGEMFDEASQHFRKSKESNNAL